MSVRKSFGRGVFQNLHSDFRPSVGLFWNSVSAIVHKKRKEKKEAGVRWQQWEPVSDVFDRGSIVVRAEDLGLLQQGLGACTHQTSLWQKHQSFAVTHKTRVRFH